MNINDTIKRINELAHKKKSGQPLTEAELAEKKKLYDIYLGFIRGQVTQTLDCVEFVEADGSITPAKQKKTQWWELLSSLLGGMTQSNDM